MILTLFISLLLANEPPAALRTLADSSIEDNLNGRGNLEGQDGVDDVSTIEPTSVADKLANVTLSMANKEEAEPPLAPYWMVVKITCQSGHIESFKTSICDSELSGKVKKGILTVSYFLGDQEQTDAADGDLQCNESKPQYKKFDLKSICDKKKIEPQKDPLIIDDDPLYSFVDRDTAAEATRRKKGKRRRRKGCRGKRCKRSKKRRRRSSSRKSNWGVPLTKSNFCKSSFYMKPSCNFTIAKNFKRALEKDLKSCVVSASKAMGWGTPSSMSFKHDGCRVVKGRPLSSHATGRAIDLRQVYLRFDAPKSKPTAFVSSDIFRSISSENSSPGKVSNSRDKTKSNEKKNLAQNSITTADFNDGAKKEEFVSIPLPERRPKFQPEPKPKKVKPKTVVLGRRTKHKKFYNHLRSCWGKKSSCHRSIGYRGSRKVTRGIPDRKGNHDRHIHLSKPCPPKLRGHKSW